MDHCDLLGLSWMHSDILNCIALNNPDKALVIQFWGPVCKQLSNIKLGNRYQANTISNLDFIFITDLRLHNNDKRLS